jgi:hypothetical protein
MELKSNQRSRDRQRRMFIRGQIPPHPNPLPRGEGAPQAGRRASAELRTYKHGAGGSPSPWGEGWGEGELAATNANDMDFATALPHA